jgi:FRG domain
MSAKRFQFDAEDYERAFALGPGAGFACNSLAELFGFVMGLLTWNKDHMAARLRIPESAKAVLTGPGAWWFRGVDSDQFPLHSGIYWRKIKGLCYSRPVADPEDLDRRLRHEYFQQTRRQFHELASYNVWDLLFEMQHYRLPTRLLDWTLNLATAAFFAVYYARQKEEEERCKPEHERKYVPSPTVWILNPRILSAVCLGEYALNDYPYLEMHGTPLEVRHWTKIPEIRGSKEFGKPNWIYRWLIRTPGHYPLNASWTNPRLAAQMGAFTLQTDAAPLDSLANGKDPKFLLKVRLEPKILASAWEELQSVGVDERYLFPERENLTKSIKEHRGL